MNRRTFTAKFFAAMASIVTLPFVKASKPKSRAWYAGRDYFSRRIPITTKVPAEFMKDFPAMQSYIDARLPYMIGNLEAEFQALYGDGTGNNLKGIFTDGYVFRPYNWEDGRLADGRLLAGKFVRTETLNFWGKPVVVSTSSA